MLSCESVAYWYLKVDMTNTGVLGMVSKGVGLGYPFPNVC